MDNKTILICHYYNVKAGKFEIFEEEVKETPKQFARLPSSNTPGYWARLPKSELDQLKIDWGYFSMYSPKENLQFFKEQVLANLANKCAAKKSEYENAQKILEAAQKAGEAT